MKRSIGDLKICAKSALQGNYGTAILGVLAAFGFSVLGNLLAGQFFGGTSLIDVILSQIFVFIVTLIAGILSAGLSYLLLNMARGRDYSLADLIYFFKNHPDRVIVAGFVLAVIDVIVSIPYYYVSFTMEMGTTIEQYTAWLTKTTGLLFLSIVLNSLITLPFVMTYYLMADELELGGIEALKMSARLMKGNKGRYLLMQISFIPLLVLSVFTLYIAQLWIIPYMEMTSVEFYRELTGELDARPPLTEEGLYPGAGSLDAYDRKDDYNSEA